MAIPRPCPEYIEINLSKKGKVFHKTMPPSTDKDRIHIPKHVRDVMDSRSETAIRTLFNALQADEDFTGIEKAVFQLLASDRLKEFEVASDDAPEEFKWHIPIGHKSGGILNAMKESATKSKYEELTMDKLKEIFKAFVK